MIQWINKLLRRQPATQPPKRDGESVDDDAILLLFAEQVMGLEPGQILIGEFDGKTLETKAVDGDTTTKGARR